MPAPRTIPAAAEHREWVVKVDGQPVARTNHLSAATVVREVNRIARARLVWLDGSAAAGDFPLASSGTFAPGRKVEIFAGALGAKDRLFSGVVVEASIEVRERQAPKLVVECRHAAFKLTVGRRTAAFLDERDDDVLSALLSGAGLAADVQRTAVARPGVVQFASTDWDLVVARAAANGMAVITDDDAVRVRRPALAAPALTLVYGATLLDLDARIDARAQPDGVRAVTWDPARQARVARDAAEPATAGTGDLAPGDLAAVAGRGPEQLFHAAIADDEAQAWADGEWLRARLGKVSGRAKCEGLSAVRAGDTVRLAGLGAHFGGDAFVAAVRHDLDAAGGWKTHLQFGAPEPPPGAGAEALVPRVAGLQLAVVEALEDPAGDARVKVRLAVGGADAAVWARVAAPEAGNERGFYFRPDVGDEIVVGFLDGDPRHPIVLGALHSSHGPPPVKPSDANDEKAYQSRSRLRLSFDDAKKAARLETAAGNAITLSEEQQGIAIVDQHGSKIVLGPDGVTIQSAAALVLKAGTSLQIQTGTGLSLQAGSALELKGAASAELSSGAVTSVKGAVVKLN